MTDDCIYFTHTIHVPNLQTVLSVSLSDANKQLSNSDQQDTTLSGIETTTMAVSSTKKLTEPWEIDYRLPEDTLPLHYEIYLHPDLGSGTFTGTVDIHLDITKTRNFLLVHTKYLDVTSIKLRKGLGVNGQEISIGENFPYDPNEFWVVKLNSDISPGQYTLTMSFTGSLTKDIVGFYKSNYMNSNNVTRYFSNTT